MNTDLKPVHAQGMLGRWPGKDLNKAFNAVKSRSIR